jgi:type I restriction enzyme, S subunit
MAIVTKLSETSATPAATVLSSGSNDALAPGWRRVRFGDVVRNVDENERNLTESGIERYVGLDHLDPESLHIKRWGLVEDGTSFTRKFTVGQVLFGKRRAYQRKVAVAEFDGICSGDILVFEAAGDELIPELLPFIVQSEGFFQHALGTSAGSLSPRTKWKDLAAYEFALPPREEQRRIAEILWAADEVVQIKLLAIDKAFDLRKSGISSLLGIRNRQEALQIARGEKMRTERGWPLKRIVDLRGDKRQCVQVGPFGSSLSSKHFTKEGTPVLKINNLTEEGGFNLEDVVYVSNEYANGFARYTVLEGDLLTAAQAVTGRSALVTSAEAGSLISQHLIRVSVDHNQCLPGYLLVCFLSNIIKIQIYMVKQKTTRDGLNTEDVENFYIPLPSIAEQKNVVDSVESIKRAERELFNSFESSSLLATRLREKLLSASGNRN